MATDKRIDPVEKALREVNLLQQNQSTTEVISRYDNWSTYDEDLGALNYRGPKVVGDAVVKYLSDKTDVRVLDVAAGTGLLKAHGFTNVDALDPSEGMLNAARWKNAYRNYIQEFFPCEKPSVKPSSYDVLVVAGGIGKGLMKCDCLPEMVRCVKTDGLIVISVREQYKDQFEPLLKQLETEGQWKILERTVFPNYHSTCNGVLFVLKVTKTDN